MKNKTIWIVAVILVCIGVSQFAKKNKEIQIGIIAPLTGVVASYGEEMKRGIEVQGPVNTVWEDDECDAKKAVSAFKKLTEIDKVKIIIGPACGSPQEAIAPLAKGKEVIVILPSAASSRLYEQSSGKIFNVQSSLEDEAIYLGEQVFVQDKKKVILVTYKNAYSQTMAHAFRSSFKGVIVKELAFTEPTDDISTQVASLKQEKFDAVVVTDINFFFAQGLAKLKQYNIQTTVYSGYPVELPAVRSFVQEVKYSFPSRIESDKGAIYVLSGEVYKFANELRFQCGNDFSCMKSLVAKNGTFDENGISKRGFVMREIKE